MHDEWHVLVFQFSLQCWALFELFSLAALQQVPSAWCLMGNSLHWHWLILVVGESNCSGWPLNELDLSLLLYAECTSSKQFWPTSWDKIYDRVHRKKCYRLEKWLSCLTYIQFPYLHKMYYDAVLSSLLYVWSNINMEYVFSLHDGPINVGFCRALE